MWLDYDILQSALLPNLPFQILFSLLLVPSQLLQLRPMLLDNQVVPGSNPTLEASFLV
jgi:hypothetical protein